MLYKHVAIVTANNSHTEITTSADSTDKSINKIVRLCHDKWRFSIFLNTRQQDGRTCPGQKESSQVTAKRSFQDINTA